MLESTAEVIEVEVKTEGDKEDWYVRPSDHIVKASLLLQPKESASCVPFYRLDFSMQECDK